MNHLTNTIICREKPGCRCNPMQTWCHVPLWTTRTLTGTFWDLMVELQPGCNYWKTTFYNIHTLPVKSWDTPYRAIFFLSLHLSTNIQIYIWIHHTKNTFNMHFALLLLTHSSSVHIPSAAVWIFRVRRTLSSSQMDQAYKLPSIFFSQHTSAQLPYCVAH